MCESYLQVSKFKKCLKLFSQSPLEIPAGEHHMKCTTHFIGCKFIPMPMSWGKLLFIASMFSWLTSVSL